MSKFTKWNTDLRSYCMLHVSQLKNYTTGTNQQNPESGKFYRTSGQIFPQRKQEKEKRGEVTCRLKEISPSHQQPHIAYDGLCQIHDLNQSVIKKKKKSDVLGNLNNETMKV